MNDGSGDMKTGYVIGWKCQTNGRIGQSKTLMTCEEAWALAAELNKTHPDYEHVPVPLGTDIHELAGILAKGILPTEALQLPLVNADSESLMEPAELDLAKMGAT